MSLVQEAEKTAEATVRIVDVTIGEALKNVNVLAGKSDPLVLPDDRYPRWLRMEVERPEKRDPMAWKKSGRIPTRTELRLMNKQNIRSKNEELGA